MPNYPVTASNKDQTVGTNASTTSTVITIAYNYGTTPTTYSYGLADIDTSAIGTDVISAATFYWYHAAYTKTKTNSFSRIITVGSVTILDSSGTPPAAGWHSQVLDSTAIAQINKTGDTQIQFNMADPTVGFNTWTVRSWDYDGAGGYACYLAVTHAPAGGPTRFSILR